MTLTAEQLEYRRNKVSSSDVPAIVGSLPSHWGTAWRVYRQKVCGDEFESTDSMDLGNHMEPWIGAKAAKHLGVELFKCEETIEHPDEPWASATPDFMDADRTLIVEIKNVGGESRYQWDAGPPAYVIDQCLWQSWVTGIDKLYVAALLGARPPVEVYEVFPDPDRLAYLIDTCKAFYEHCIVGGNEPAVDGSKDAKEHIASQAADHDDRIVEAPEEALSLFAEWARVKGTEESAKDERQRLENELAKLAGENLGIKGAWGTARWIETKGGLVSFEKKPSRYLRIFPNKDAVKAAKLGVL